MWGHFLFEVTFLSVSVRFRVWSIITTALILQTADLEDYTPKKLVEMFLCLWSPTFKKKNRLRLDYLLMRGQLEQKKKAFDLVNFRD